MRAVARTIAAVLVAVPTSLRAAPAAEPPGPPAGATATAPAPAAAEPGAPTPDLEVTPIEPDDDGLGWDDPPPPTPVSPPTTTTTTAVAESEPPRQPTPGHIAMRKTGTGLLIGAGAVGFAATALNGVRAYVVSGPCQTDSQVGCTGGWMLTTGIAWALNITAIPLAATGGSLRGKWAATYAAGRHGGRAPGLIATGGVMVVLGVLANVTLRSMWFYDYVHPEGREMFDFAYPGDALAYYGGLQLSASLVAAGAGMLAYGAAGPFKPPKTALRMTLGLSPHGVSVGGRF
jgi:hypothetical protein